MCFLLFLRNWKLIVKLWIKLKIRWKITQILYKKSSLKSINRIKLREEMSDANDVEFNLNIIKNLTDK